MPQDPSEEDDLQALRKDLLGVPEGEYGDHYRTHVLEIYGRVVEMADRISQRRQSTNSFFLTLNSALVALVGYVQLGGSTGADGLFYGPVSLAGIVVSYVWYRLVRSYRDLNSGKFKVVHAIESLLPLRPYDAEWTALGKGKDQKKYLQLTRLEATVPWVFLALHGVVLWRSMPWGDWWPW